MLKISACVIVKNEENNLPSWLNCVKRFADEIIVVDTGSTDNSKKIAADANAKVFDFKWQNDFAAAKNFAIDKAKGEWICFLDADETITKATIDKVRPLLKNGTLKINVAGYCCRLINREKTFPYSIRSYSVQIRFFRRKKDIKYVGAIHESLNIPQGYRIELTMDIEINHTGYSSEIIEDKLKRNIVLLNNKTKLNNGYISPLMHKYFMDCFYGLEKYEEAIEHAKLAIKNKIGKEWLLGVYTTLIALYQKANYDELEILDLINDAMQVFSQDNELILIKGLYLHKIGDYISAEICLKRGIDAPQDNELTLHKLSSNFEKYIPLAFEALGDIYLKKFNYQLGEEYLLKSLLANKYRESVLAKLMIIWRNKGINYVDNIIILNQIYVSKNERDYLIILLNNIKEFKLARYYYGLSNNNNKILDIVGNEEIIKWQHPNMVVELLSEELEQLYMVAANEKNKYREDQKNMLDMLLPEKYKAGKIGDAS